MKIIVITLVFVFIVSLSSYAEKERPLNRPESALAHPVRTSLLIEEAVPNLKYKMGDKSWIGGSFASALLQHPRVGVAVSFDTNTAYAVFTVTDGKKVSASTISNDLIRYIAKKFKFNTENPSYISEPFTFMPPKDREINKNDFSKQFMLSRLGDNNVHSPTEFLTVQVVRVSDTEFGITLTYLKLAGNWPS